MGRTVIYDTIENNSSTYYNGSIWESNNYGEFEIVGKCSDKNKHGKYEWYLIKFRNSPILKVSSTAIKRGNVKNPYKPSVYGVGFMGIGEHRASNGNGIHTEEYVLWKDMLKRCYSGKYEEYNDCTVDTTWFNFQVFCEDIRQLKGYNDWKLKKGFHLDKDKFSKNEEKNTQKTIAVLFLKMRMLRFQT